MTREEFVTKFHWNKVMAVMAVMGLVNVLALIPQPLSILRTQVVAGVAWQMFAIFAFVQAAFGIEFFLKKSWSAMTSMAVSFCLSVFTIILYFIFI